MHCVVRQPLVRKEEKTSLSLLEGRGESLEIGNEAKTRE